jgi:KipI family sensor histidine kinase inhibitor
MSPFNITAFGGDSVLITCPDVDVPTFADRLRSALRHLEVRVGLDSVLLTGQNLPDAAAVLALMPTSPDVLESRAHHTIPVRYDGADLVAVANFLELSVEGLIALHVGVPWQVAMLGFAPGFPYLRPVPDHSRRFDTVPRLASPRSQVPRGSVAVAAGMSCIYPNLLPGGWNLLGHTTTRLFDPRDDDKPALMQPGDLVTFSAVT